MNLTEHQLDNNHAIRSILLLEVILLEITKEQYGEYYLRIDVVHNHW